MIRLPIITDERPGQEPTVARGTSWAVRAVRLSCPYHAVTETPVPESVGEPVVRWATGSLGRRPGRWPP